MQRSKIISIFRGIALFFRKTLSYVCVYIRAQTHAPWKGALDLGAHTQKREFRCVKMQCTPLSHSARISHSVHISSIICFDVRFFVHDDINVVVIARGIEGASRFQSWHRSNCYWCSTKNSNSGNHTGSQMTCFSAPSQPRHTAYSKPGCNHRWRAGKFGVSG